MAKDANDVRRELGINGLRELGDSLPDLDFRGVLPKAKGNGLDAGKGARGDAPALPAPLKFPIIAWKDITFGLIAEWLLKRVLPRKGGVVFYRVSGATKRFVLLDILLHIAVGRQ